MASLRWFIASVRANFRITRRTRHAWTCLISFLAHSLLSIDMKRRALHVCGHPRPVIAQYQGTRCTKLVP
ncbi:hypothetical protein DDI_1016 [Dickeya dianthicola RNS04.9]|nr:hypothetical protein DDI_1016 [Dickeya dianthicola RNS04.9]